MTLVCRWLQPRGSKSSQPTPACPPPFARTRPPRRARSLNLDLLPSLLHPPSHLPCGSLPPPPRPQPMVKPEPTEGVVPAPSPSHRRPAVPASSSSAAHDPHGASTAAPDVTPQNELLPSFFKIEPFDEMQKRIGDWIWSVSRGHKHVEVGPLSPATGDRRARPLTRSTPSSSLRPDRGQDWPDEAAQGPAPAAGNDV